MINDSMNYKRITIFAKDTQNNMNLKSATPFPKCYLQEKWTFDS